MLIVGCKNNSLGHEAQKEIAQGDLPGILSDNIRGNQSPLFID